MKNNKGITLVALIITIIVILIIVGITATSATNLIQKSKMTDYIAYMKLVKARADDVYEEEVFQGNSPFTKEISVEYGIYKTEDNKTGEGTDEERKNFTKEKKKFFGDPNPGKYDSYTFLKWKQEDIADQGIDNSVLNEGQYFLIIFDESNWEIVDVVYSAGCALGNQRYYTLKDMERIISGN